VYSMYKPIAERDDETVNALLNFYKKIYNVIGVIILLAGFAVLTFLSRFISGAPPEGANIYIIFIVFLLNTSISYLLYGYKVSLLNANQRTDVINNIGCKYSSDSGSFSYPELLCVHPFNARVYNTK